MFMQSAVGLVRRHMAQVDQKRLRGTLKWPTHAPSTIQRPEHGSPGLATQWQSGREGLLAWPTTAASASRPHLPLSTLSRHPAAEIAAPTHPHGCELPGAQASFGPSRGGTGVQSVLRVGAVVRAVRHVVVDGVFACAPQVVVVLVVGGTCWGGASRGKTAVAQPLPA